MSLVMSVNLQDGRNMTVETTPLTQYIVCRSLESQYNSVMSSCVCKSSTSSFQELEKKCVFIRASSVLIKKMHQNVKKSSISVTAAKGSHVKKIG